MDLGGIDQNTMLRNNRKLEARRAFEGLPTVRLGDLNLELAELIGIGFQASCVEIPQTNQVMKIFHRQETLEAYPEDLRTIVLTKVKRIEAEASKVKGGDIYGESKPKINLHLKDSERLVKEQVIALITANLILPKCAAEPFSVIVTDEGVSCGYIMEKVEGQTVNVARNPDVRINESISLLRKAGAIVDTSIHGENVIQDTNGNFKFIDLSI